VYTDNFGALLGVTAAAVRTAAGATTTGAALLTAADAAAARTAIGAIDAGSRTFTGAIATSAGDITAQAGSFRSQIAGAPTTGQIVLGNGSARLFWGGAAFDLNGPLTVDGSPVAPRPTASAGVGQWVQINVESNTYTLPGGGSWAYNWQGYSGNFLSGESAGVSAGGTVFSIGPVGSPRFRGFAWRIA
jgi:hypothetical protein